ncbi:nicotinamidase [Acetobacter conturbans]|nr:nicotinamidase [Acetobacter conturbans]
MTEAKPISPNGKRGNEQDHCGSAGKDRLVILSYSSPMLTISSADALLVVDVQNDFLPGGALAVPDGDAVIPIINRLMRLPFGAIVATQDWHPAGHCSFREQGGPWPEHCLTDTQGAALADALDRAPLALELRKGRTQAVDSYSAFVENDRLTHTILADWLSERAIKRVFVTGLALDYCVTATAMDARRAGFESLIVVDACRGIAPEAEAIAQATAAGIRIVKEQDLS